MALAIWRQCKRSDWSQDQQVFTPVHETTWLWRKLHPKFSCFSVRVETCCTGLPARLPINEIPGEPGLQSAANNRHRHTPREHNLNYTIWTLCAESESFLSMPHSSRAHPLQSIKQPGVRPLQSIKQPGARPLQCIKQPGAGPLQSIKQLGVHPHQSVKQLGACPLLPIKQCAQNLE